MKLLIQEKQSGVSIGLTAFAGSLIRQPKNGFN